MKTLQIAVMAIALVTATWAHGQSYNITFTGSTFTANGQIGVVGGVADSGYLTVTSANPAVDTGTYNLVNLTSPLINGVGYTLVLPTGDEIFDDVVNASSSPFLTDNGLEFANTDSVGFNLWGNSPGSYTLFDMGSGVYVGDNGSASLTVVPEPSTIGLVMIGLLGALAIRRRKS